MATVLILIGSFIAIAAVIYFLTLPGFLSGKRAELQEIKITIYGEEGSGSNSGDSPATVTIIDEIAMQSVFNELQHAKVSNEIEDVAFYDSLTLSYGLTIKYTNSTDELLIYDEGIVRNLNHSETMGKISSVSATRLIAFLQLLSVRGE